ncbi:hypothetical protein D9758_009111 [Tetrapyrgos nigripes]|uniref:F-box domain-containing protein n=1 Tax=Tetrapyrgos nigripes TaxID=182062 RepID=A0A8H5G8P3_9AGAR|nr:hypothetical protein D9758_009111 [Tetrapyrgos nigripes]
MVSEGKSTDYLNDDVSRERVVLSATVIASLQSRMKDEQNHIGDLSREVEKLQKEIEKRKGVVAKIKDLLSPIRQIPQEMLVEIFSHYIQLQNAEVKGPDFGVLGRKCVYRRLLPVVLLSLICSQWKQIVDTTPRLWTQLRIFVYNWFYPVTPPPQTVVVKWIQRSGSLPL